jgi:hypothetical protein
MNSPGLRVVIGIWDANEEAVKLLRKEALRLYATTLYEFSFDVEFRPNTNEKALYEAAFWLCTNSKHALLVLEIGFAIVDDLTLLPVELQACDFAVYTKKPKNSGWCVAYPLPFWLRHSTRTYHFLMYLHKTCIALPPHLLASDADLLNGAIKKYNRKLIVSCMPEHYRSERRNENSRIVTMPHQQQVASKEVLVSPCQQHIGVGIEPKKIILLPLQDIGTKYPLENNSFSMRVKRLSRPGRISWRAMAKLLAECAHEPSKPARILPVAQWEVTQDLIDELNFADQIYIPHKTQKQISSDKAIFYMQEHLPEVFTVSRTGWGPSAEWAKPNEARLISIDPRLQAFKARFKAERKTKAQQNKKIRRRLPDFDILAVLQVPNDEALTLFANCNMENFIADIAKLAAKENLKVLIRKHPLDRTNFFERMTTKWQSERLLFNSAGHIHDVLAKADCVAVINSGVGLEAMLLEKPVIAYGRAIYENAVFAASSKTLCASYHQAIAEPDEVRIERYDQFLSWFLYRASFKLDEPQLNLEINRTGSASRQPNPAYHFYLKEQKLAQTGASHVKITNRTYLSRLIKKLATKTHRPLKKAQNFIKKNYYNQAISQTKSMLIPHFSAEMLSGKRVCLVGNSGSLLEKDLAEYIDRHDIVIRMNLGCPYIVRDSLSIESEDKKYIYGVFVDMRSSRLEKYTVLDPRTPKELLKHYTAGSSIGTKTSIWSCSTADRSRQLFFAPLFNARNVAPHPSLYHLSVEFIRRYNVERLPSHCTIRLQDKLSAVPTSGLIWLEFLRHTQLSELNMVGFDFKLSNHMVRRGLSLLEATGKYRHNPERERNYVNNCVLAAHKNVHLY